MSDRQSLSRLRWRCRRGMRELDVVLIRYLEQCYPEASAAHREAFHALIELSDPELFDLLRGRTQAASPEAEAVVGELRRPH
jgi:antitoxin CptB